MTYYSMGITGPLDQGDILVPISLQRYLPWSEEIKRPLVIVTPTCDLAQQKSDYHRLCVLHPLPYLLYLIGKKLGLLEAHWKGAEVLSKNKWGDIHDKLGKAIRNAWPRYHFLPSEQGVFQTDYIIDFEVLATIPLSDLKVEDRHAQINAPFKQELIQRLSSFMMRIGTPDLAQSMVDTIIARCVSETGLRTA